MAKKRTDPAAAKRRKQKIVAIVGAVLLAAVLVFQVPRTMRMLDSGAGEAVPPPPPAESQQSPGGAAGSPAATGETPSAPASAAPTAGAQGGLVDSDVAPEPDEGDLASFERFSSKDPFVPQVDTASTAPAPAATAAAAPVAADSDAGTGGPFASTAPVPATSSPAPTAAASQPAPGTTATRASAEISINGKSEVVPIRTAFPQSDPTFRLVGVKDDSVRIAIAADGTFTSGAQVMLVRKGKPLTLVNTEDGSRYVVILLSVV